MKKWSYGLPSYLGKIDVCVVMVRGFTSIILYLQSYCDYFDLFHLHHNRAAPIHQTLIKFSHKSFLLSSQNCILNKYALRFAVVCAAFKLFTFWHNWNDRVYLSPCNISGTLYRASILLVVSSLNIIFSNSANYERKN